MGEIGSGPPLHPDAFTVNEALVRNLVEDQFPDLRGAALSEVAGNGTDNYIYRLGQEMYVRLPQQPSASQTLDKELTCLPKLTGLPLTIPTPLRRGAASPDYPSPWAIYNWISGETVTRDGLSDMAETARALGQFMSALQKIDASQAPLYGAHNNYRGCPLIDRDAPTRQAIEALADLYSASALLRLWDDLSATPAWSRAPVWVHGDIHATNLLMREGTLTAVIDFGLLGAGDPAVDLIVAWSLLDGDERELFRTASGADDVTWQRGKGWALSTAVIALAYYRNKHAYLSGMSKRVIEAVQAAGTP